MAISRRTSWLISVFSERMLKWSQAATEGRHVIYPESRPQMRLVCNLPASGFSETAFNRPGWHWSLITVIYVGKTPNIEPAAAFFVIIITIITAVIHNQRIRVITFHVCESEKNQSDLLYRRVHVFLTVEFWRLSKTECGFRWKFSSHLGYDNV